MGRLGSTIRIVVMVVISSGMIVMRADDLRTLLGKKIVKAMGLRSPELAIKDEAVASSIRHPTQTKSGRPVMALDCDSIFLGINQRGEIVSKLTREQIKAMVVVKGCPTYRCMIDGAIPFPEVGIALSLLESLRRYPYVAQRTEAIDLSDFHNPRLELEDSMVVNVGLDDYPGKLRRLCQVIAYAETLSLDIRRVDLRFGNQVVVEAEEKQEQKPKSGRQTRPGEIRGG